jgi:TolB-like protein
MLLLRLTSRSGQEYCVKSALARETGVKNHAPGRLSSLRRAIAQQSARPSRYPVPDVPSIAVLPFQSMSADGMVEDIITGLSRILRLFVIARNSRLTYKGQVVDVKRVGRELGVRYVLSNRPQT